jgi:hypothetical protein
VLTFTQLSVPPRAGFRIALLYFCACVMAALPRLYWWTAKALLVAGALMVAIVASGFNRNG